MTQNPIAHNFHDVNLDRDIGIGRALLCPRCGGSNLHHDTVAIFNRGEDEEQVRQTTVTASATVVEITEGKDNPSERRSGIAIQFSCETCEDKATMEMTIAQHKGTTFLRWRWRA